MKMKTLFFDLMPDISNAEMKTLYFDCRTGASGDMIVGALLDLVPDRAASLARLNAMGIPGVSAEAKDATRCGIRGVEVTVSVNGEVEGHDHHHDHDHQHEHHEHHHHASMDEIFAIVDAMSVSDGVKSQVKKVYASIAAAEAKAHGVDVSEVHFHEVGAKDAVFDVAAAVALVGELAPSRILAAVPEVGGGFAKCAHGVLPVPAPATVNLLEGVPFSSGAADCELLTPTGAALLRHFATSFGPMPTMAVEKTGVGCGARDMPGRPNVLRAFLGDESRSCGLPNGRVVELKANIDDMTGEELGHACDKLRAAGALDVSLVPTFMKKGRPGHTLVVLCSPDTADAMVSAVLRETSTFGVRRADLSRYELDRTIEVGPDGVRVKKGTGFGVEKSKREFDDEVSVQRKEQVK